MRRSHARRWAAKRAPAGFPPYHPNLLRPVNGLSPPECRLKSADRPLALVSPNHQRNRESVAVDSIAAGEIPCVQAAAVERSNAREGDSRNRRVAMALLTTKTKPIVSALVLGQNRDPQKKLGLFVPARVAKLVDAGDSKSPGGNTVPVRVRPRVPLPLLRPSQAPEIAHVFINVDSGGRQSGRHFSSPIHLHQAWCVLFLQVSSY